MMYGLAEIGLSPKMVSANEMIKAIYALFPGIMAICVVCCVINIYSENFCIRILSFFLLGTIIVQLILMQSRSRAIWAMLPILVIHQTIRKINLKNNLMLIIFIVAIVLAVSTARRVTGGRYYEAGIGIEERIAITYESAFGDSALRKTREGLSLDFAYRLNALEWTAAILDSQENMGRSILYGEVFFWAAYQAFPNIFLPFPKEEPEQVVNRHYHIAEVDQNSNIFGSAVADGGLLGIPVIFFLIGIFHGLIWRGIGSGRTSPSILLSFFAIIPNLEPFGNSAGTHKIGRAHV